METNWGFLENNYAYNSCKKLLQILKEGFSNKQFANNVLFRTKLDVLSKLKQINKLFPIIVLHGTVCEYVGGPVNYSCHVLCELSKYYYYMNRNEYH